MVQSFEKNMKDLGKEIEQVLNLLDTTYKQTSGKKKVILDKGKTVYLQVALFKTPFTAPRKRKFLRLCHSLHGTEPEICLFVPNRKTGVEYKKSTDELIDFCVDYYTDILEKHKIKGITTVMPLKQLKSEYGTYELRRKLVHRYDLFLCKNSLLYNSRFLTSLGKIFRVANKEPLGVPFPKDNADYDPEFQKNIKRAILTSSFYITRFSDNYSIPVGSLSHTREELRENLELVLHQIFNENVIPGGVRNIRAMYVWPSQEKPVPLYMSPEFPSDMKKPSVKSKRKRLRGVEGEISTQPQKKVFVTPSGEVFVTKIEKDGKEPEASDSEDDESFLDESDNDGNADKVADDDEEDDDDDDKKRNLKSEKAADGNEEDSESEGDEEIEEKEARLLEMKRRTSSNFHSKRKISPNAKEVLENNLKVNKSNKRKSGQSRNDEKGNLIEGNKLIKTKGKKRKINKTKRKMLIKQEKFNKKEKTKRKRI